MSTWLINWNDENDDDGQLWYCYRRLCVLKWSPLYGWCMNQAPQQMRKFVLKIWHEPVWSLKYRTLLWTRFHRENCRNVAVISPISTTNNGTVSVYVFICFLNFFTYSELDVLRVTSSSPASILELVTTFGGSTVPVLIKDTQAHSAWPSLCGCSCSDCTGDGFGHIWEETSPLKLLLMARFINQFIIKNIYKSACFVLPGVVMMTMLKNVGSFIHIRQRSSFISWIISNAFAVFF